MPVPEYRFLTDWEGLGYLGMSSFESGTLETWIPGGTIPPALDPSTTRSYDGDWSMRITWATGGSFPQAQFHGSGFIIGRTYVVTGWAYVPSGGNPGLLLGIPLGSVLGTASNVTDTWQQIRVVFTAQSSRHEIQVWPSFAPTAGQVGYVDRIRVSPVGTDITSRVLAREPVGISYGRDQVRSLSPTGPAEASLVLNNQSRDYSPENTSSPLNGYILPNREAVIEATWNGKAYTLFRGKTDAFDVLPNPNDLSVSLTFLDALAGLRGQEISTEVHFGITTGEAVHLILDAVGWPATARDIDNGVSGIHVWWEEGTDAGSALEKVIHSEGPPALVFISPTGDFVFRDRHHRLTRTASLVSQATISDVAEPAFSAPLVYDHGWRDIINSVTFSVEERGPSPLLEAVWTSDTTYSLSDGQTLPVTVQPSDPVVGAVAPQAGVDFLLRTGAVTTTLSRTSGGSVTIFLKATGGPAVVDGLQLRAYPVVVLSTTQIHAEDSASIQQYGRRSYPNDAPWANVHDAAAIAEVILAQRAQRLPIATIRLVSGGSQPQRTLQQLTRDLSDRITIVDSETGLADPFYIDRIEHTISEGGQVLETVFGCEKAPAPAGNSFRFGVAGRGFNDGAFAQVGLDEPANMFRFDTTGQGFNDGLLAH